MVTGYRVTQVVRAAALCNLAAHLEAGAGTAGLIAAARFPAPTGPGCRARRPR